MLNKIQSELYRLVILWLIGGLIYGIMEILFRGYTHWSMIIVGGICFIEIGGMNNYLPWEMSLLLQGLIGAVIITTNEFIAGIILNLILGWDIWDYSGMPGNVLGQICLPFCCIWFVLAIVAVIVDDYIRWGFDGCPPNEKPVYYWYKKRPIFT